MQTFNLTTLLKDKFASKIPEIKSFILPHEGGFKINGWKLSFSNAQLVTDSYKNIKNYFISIVVNMIL